MRRLAALGATAIVVLGSAAPSSARCSRVPQLHGAVVITPSMAISPTTTLKASFVGRWLNDPDGFHYEWQRYQRRWISLPGGSGGRRRAWMHLRAGAIVDEQLRVIVYARNRCGKSEPIPSAATAPVLADPPAGSDTP